MLQGRLGTLGTAGYSLRSVAVDSMRARHPGVPARCEDAGHFPVYAGDEMLATSLHQAKGGSEWSVVPDSRRNEIMGDAVSAL